MQASPASISIQGQSTITATLRDSQNNLVQGQTVNFQLTDNTGGTLSVAFATTNGQGQAQTVYTASTSSSATNGVIITATVQGTALTQNAELTVGGQSVFLSLGTGNQIAENGTKTQFVMPFTVQAIDASGNAVNGAQITLAVHSDDYGKGGHVLSSGVWAQTGTPSVPTPAAVTICPNEDLNQTVSSGRGRHCSDRRTDHGRVDFQSGRQPGRQIGAGQRGGRSRRDQRYGDHCRRGGVAAFTVTYPEDHANWVQVTLTATTTVQGTQAQTSMTFWLPILASYLTSSSSGTPPVRQSLRSRDPVHESELNRASLLNLKGNGRLRAAVSFGARAGSP